MDCVREIFNSIIRQKFVWMRLEGEIYWNEIEDCFIFAKGKMKIVGKVSLLKFLHPSIYTIFNKACKGNTSMFSFYIYALDRCFYFMKRAFETPHLFYWYRETTCGFFEPTLYEKKLLFEMVSKLVSTVATTLN